MESLHDEPQQLFGNHLSYLLRVVCGGPTLTIAPTSVQKALSESFAARLSEAVVSERRCRERIGAGTLDEAAELWRPHPPCPDCRFLGMKKANLQSYLNWFVYLSRIRRDEEKWPKTARVLRHLLMSDACFRS